MSVLFDSSSKALIASLANAPLETQFRLITAWVKRPAGYALGSKNNAVHLAYDQFSETLQMQLYSDSSNRAIAKIRSLALSTGNLTNDTWSLVAVVDGPSGEPPQGYGYLDGTRTWLQLSGVVTSTGKRPNLLGIGRSRVDVGARWRGYIAEVAIWTPTGISQSDAIVNELLTKAPDAVTVASPVWYAPLRGDASVTTGTALTTIGSPVFDASEHPPVGAEAAPPAAPVIAATTNINQTYARINWADVSSDETAFDVEIESPSGAGNWAAVDASPAAANATFAVVSLASGTQYRPRVRSRNASGASAWSTGTAFTTPGVVTKRVKLLTHPDMAGASGVKVEVFLGPTSGRLTGSFVGSAVGRSFNSALTGTEAELSIAAADIGASGLATGTALVAVFEGVTAAGSPLGSAVSVGSVGPHECTLVED